MKKIVVISGSPRKNGNTMRIVRQIENNMKKLDSSVEFKYLMLKDKKLKYCIGCMDCIRVGGVSACPHKDDAQSILQIMHGADALIFASPGYSHSVNAIYKNFMDRFMFLDHLPELIGKPAVIVATSGGDGINEVTNFMAGNGIEWWGCNIVAKYGVNAMPYYKNEKYRQKVNKKLETIAKKLRAELYDAKLKHPPLKQYITFHYNKMETAMDDKGVPGRYNLWKDKGWLDADYYYPVRIKFTYRVIRFLLMGFFQVMIKMMWGKDFKDTISDFQTHEKDGKYSLDKVEPKPIYV